MLGPLTYRPAIPFPHMQVRALGGREGGRLGERYQSAHHLHHGWTGCFEGWGMQETDYNMRHQALLRDEVVARLKQLGNVTTLFLTLLCLLFFEQCLSLWRLFFYHCMCGHCFYRKNSWNNCEGGILSKHVRLMEHHILCRWAMQVAFCSGHFWVQQQWRQVTWLSHGCKMQAFSRKFSSFCSFQCALGKDPRC